MQACGARSKTGTVVGGGLLGLEAAKALRDMGLETHVVEFAPRLMAVQVDDGGGRVLRAKIEALGVHGAYRQEHARDRRWRSARAPHGVRRRHASRHRHDRVLRGHPPARRDRARQRVSTIGARGGIVIDDACRTSDPNDLRDRRMRVVERPDVRPRRAGLRHGARRREADRRRATRRSPAPT